MKIEIKSWLTGSVLFEGDFSSVSEAVRAAIKSHADLSSANLSSANLSHANLRSANLRYANLRYANLSSANLSSANLSHADLSSANLRYANLSHADLSSANLSSAAHSWAQVAFMGHGECGRMLTALQIKEGADPMFFCGCFTGSEKALRKYIADGAKHLAKTRTLAIDTALTLLAAQNDKG